MKKKKTTLGEDATTLHFPVLEVIYRSLTLWNCPDKLRTPQRTEYVFSIRSELTNVRI